MSNLTSLAAWKMLSGFALRSAETPEDELAALDASAAVAAELALENEAQLIRKQCAEMRSVNARRIELRDYFDGQLRLNLGSDSTNGGGDTP